MDFQPKSQEFVKCLADFFKRDLISIPLIKKYPHQLITQRSGLRAATLELDTSAFPNIEYIAGNRLSIYPINPIDHVNTIMKHLVDDICPSPSTTTSSTSVSNQQSRFKRPKMSEPWGKFVTVCGKDSLKIALLFLYDIMMAPSRDLLRLMADCCSNKEQKSKLLAICKSDDSWDKWICHSLRTLKSTFDEFSSCSISARSLFSKLTLQQPRQYSISSIKSSKRFRTEIIVVQHKFTPKQIALFLQNMKEHEQIQQQDGKTKSPTASFVNPSTVHVNHNDSGSQRSTSSVRSLRSMAVYNVSPISSQQVKKVPSYSGPLMSLYASSTLGTTEGKQTSGSLKNKSLPSQIAADASNSTSSKGKNYDGLCSNYLLNLNSNDYVVCEFVENPRFTLKGNRERPIMMIGQDIGVVSFRPFWQQRALEHDRAQIFYTLFKDLKPKKFGDMQLVCITGNRCRIEDLFKREINATLTNKIISSASYINRSQLLSLLDSAADANSSKRINIESKELLELGSKIAKLLLDANGCLYTCCDPQITQALEILVVEGIVRNRSIPRDKIMSLLPGWKGRRLNEQPLTNNKFLFTLENPFERAQIVQEIIYHHL